MADVITEAGSLYSPAVGILYVFNLIVGTGALTMPMAFASAGWLISLILIIILALMSYITVTFVVESMACANAMIKVETSTNDKHTNRYVEETDERTPLIEGSGNLNELAGNEKQYEITRRVEMGQMAKLFFNKIGVNLFYICIAIYLYGDLAIYAVAVPKSLRDVICTYKPKNNVNSSSLLLLSNYSHANDSCRSPVNNDPCWENVKNVDRVNAYRICLTIFTVLLGPFVFFNVQKTKYLQIFTTLLRWISFGTMIILAIMRLTNGQSRAHPKIIDISGVPTLFGVCVYSFMCHHSLPSLVTPIKKKNKIFTFLAADYLLILGFYLLLSFTGIFAFQHVKDLYTLNFLPNDCDKENGGAITNVKFLSYFLALFPVFTLSSNFPIISITLRNNIRSIFNLDESSKTKRFLNKIAFPLLALVPPICVAYGTDNVEFLVSFTGSYAGAGIQYVIPAALVIYGRRTTVDKFGTLQINKHQSPFKHTIWTWIVLIWAFLCIVLVTVNHIINR